MERKVKEWSFFKRKNMNLEIFGKKFILIAFVVEENIVCCNMNGN